MADITDIKTILYTEKSLNLQENGVVVIQTSPKMTKNSLKAVLKGCVAGHNGALGKIRIAK